MPPDSGENPAVWLNVAREHLAATKIDANPVRVRCFHGQRAAELALKALLLHYAVEVPKVHSLERLALLLPFEVPDAVREAAGLTAYAVEEMYPDTFNSLTANHADDASAQAVAVVEWVSNIILSDV